MPTVTVNRADVTAEEVVSALQQGLGSKYKVQPRSGRPDMVSVELSVLSTARVHIVTEGSATKLHVHGGGIIIGRIVNEFGIANKVAHALRGADLDTTGGDGSTAA